eukprot:SAG11_NODE_4344_length_1940_cov_1.562738_2_plen_90_part_00
MGNQCCSSAENRTQSSGSQPASAAVAIAVDAKAKATAAAAVNSLGQLSKQEGVNTSMVRAQLCPIEVPESEAEAATFTSSSLDHSRSHP